MAEIKILISGYAKETKEGLLASSTTTLVKERGLNIIVDPGANKELIKKLEEEGLKPEEIDYVLVTHYHLDHTLNTALFPKAKVLDCLTVYENDREYDHEGKIPGTDLKIFLTPGHADEMCSLIVPTSKGKVVIASDNFWWMDHEKQKININKKDPYASDMKTLIKSRKKILKIADWIIPGHGKMFKVEKKWKRSTIKD